MRHRKGQAAAAAALLAVIAGLIVLYILFLPSAEREKILGEGNQTSGLARVAEKNTTLLSEAPGRIDFLSQKRIDHSIPTTHIFTRTSGMALERKDSLYVKRSLFSSVEGDMIFNVEDLANTDNVLLSFTVFEGQGRLMIALNEEEIFNKEVTGGNVPPLVLAKKLLKAENALHFRVSSPGIAFWRTNVYDLREVQITGDVTRTEAQRSKSVFLVSSVEFNNLERARLKFQADCDLDFVGPLDVWINQYNVYSAVPDCGVGRLSLEFPASYLGIGENELIFSIEQGDYTLSHVTVESELKQIDFPVYFFELSEEQYQELRSGRKKVVVRLDFVDTIERKQGELIVNGHVTGFDTREIFLEEDVTDDVVRGNNGVKIKPERTLDVRQLSVLLVSR